MLCKVTLSADSRGALFIYVVLGLVTALAWPPSAGAEATCEDLTSCVVGGLFATLPTSAVCDGRTICQELSDADLGEIQRWARQSGCGNAVSAVTLNEQSLALAALGCSAAGAPKDSNARKAMKTICESQGTAQEIAATALKVLTCDVAGSLVLATVGDGPLTRKVVDWRLGITRNIWTSSTFIDRCQDLDLASHLSMKERLAFCRDKLYQEPSVLTDEACVWHVKSVTWPQGDRTREPNVKGSCKAYNHARSMACDSLSEIAIHGHTDDPEVMNALQDSGVHRSVSRFDSPRSEVVSAEASEIGVLPTEYKVRVLTSDKSGAGTDEDIYIKILGMGDSPKETGWRFLDKSGDDFESGDDDVYTFEGVGVGSLGAVMLKMKDNGTAGPDWHVRRITVYKDVETVQCGSETWVREGKQSKTAWIKEWIDEGTHGPFPLD